MLFFFFNDTATTEIYTLSLHDALPISHDRLAREGRGSPAADVAAVAQHGQLVGDLEQLLQPMGDVEDAFALGRSESTRLNSSHLVISYAVFCLKKKKRNHPYDCAP